MKRIIYYRRIPRIGKMISEKNWRKICTSKLKAKVKGKKEKEIEMYVNSFSDYSVLTPEIINEIDAKIVKVMEEIRVGGGEKIEAPLFEIDIEVKDPVTGKVKEAKTRAIALEGEEPIIGIDALSKLGLKVDFEKKTYRL